MSGTLKSVLFVASGGAIGSALRYLVAVMFRTVHTGEFPWHTFTVNILGCLLIGVLFSVTLTNNSEFIRLFLMIGILGGFTTFSSFGLETFHLLKSGRTYLALFYFLSTNITGFIAVYAGYSFHKLS